MPLHDWRDDRGWDGVHLVWLAQLLDWVQPRLPAGYRVYLRTTGIEPDQDAVATFTLDSHRALPIDLEHTYQEAARRAYLV